MDLKTEATVATTKNGQYPVENSFKVTTSPTISTLGSLKSESRQADLDMPGYGLRDFALRLPDDTYLPAETDLPLFTLVIHDPTVFSDALGTEFDELSAAEAFIDGRFDVEGDLEAAVRFADYLSSNAQSMRQFFAPFHGSQGDDRSNGRIHDSRRMAQLQGDVHSRWRDQQAIAFHYDLSNDFYALWLDRRMIYSCAYFRNRHQDIETAQLQKLEHICRKLRLRPGQRLLDIGCGWGGLLIYAAKFFGVRGVGITLSAQQARLAQRRIDAAGLQGQCEVRLCDYREIDELEKFDKIVSVGMYEHVGRAQAPSYFQIIWRLLRPCGVFLNHAISDQTYAVSSEPTFMTRYVFPDGELLPISTTLKFAESAGFEVRDVESLREHYRLTLERWLQRLEEHASDAVRLVGEQSYRIWRLFLAGCARRFAIGQQNIFQSLLVKPEQGISGLPLTRADWY
jgi:cyclopropane-fatty-acyl-phospholipid synthase